MKFEILCRDEDEAVNIYDQIATCMKKYDWREPIVIWSDMPDPKEPSNILSYVRVGVWDHI
jgi:hypothetical protein